jgi:hypothetical protein
MQELDEMDEKTLFSGFIMVIEEDNFNNVIQKLSKYEQHIVLNHDLNYQKGFCGKNVIIVKGCNSSIIGESTLDQIPPHLHEDQFMGDEEEVRQCREDAFSKFEEMIMQDLNKVILETFDE